MQLNLAWRPLFACLLALVCTLYGTVPAFAQDEEEELPLPEDVSMQTKDGVELKATFYGSLLGKDAVPVILLHGYKGKRQDFAELALTLQNAGHAVLVPDLRGHGDSTKQLRYGVGPSINLDASKLRKEDIIAMSAASGDVEECKKFLLRKNNSGELNIEKLCVVGAEMGATVAVNWAALDWSWPPIATGKQGQDVRALVLLSPELSFKGVPITAALNHPALQRELSVLMIVGRADTSSLRDAVRMEKLFAKLRPAPPTDEKERLEQQDLFFYRLDTNLGGTKLLGEKSLKAIPMIVAFIQLRLVDKTFAWSDRSKK
jgi:pimeloyl-ACP methyl ester carboxylesterase